MAIHLKTIRGSKLTQILLRKELAREVLSDSKFFGYKDPTNFFGFESGRIYNLSVIILYWIHVR